MFMMTAAWDLSNDPLANRPLSFYLGRCRQGSVSTSEKAWLH